MFDLMILLVVFWFAAEGLLFSLQLPRPRLMVLDHASFM